MKWKKKKHYSSKHTRRHNKWQKLAEEEYGKEKNKQKYYRLKLDISFK